MATPVLSVTYDKQVYAPGETITATVNYSDPDTKTVSDVWSATNQNGEHAEITVTRKVVDPVDIVPPAGYTEVPGSDTGAVVKFTPDRLMPTETWVARDAAGHQTSVQTSYSVSTPPPPTTAEPIIGMSAPENMWDQRVSEVGTVGLKARRIFADLAQGAKDKSGIIEDAVRAGMMPVISYKVGGDFAGAATGKFDTVAKQAAAYLDSLGVQCTVTIWHEPNGDMTGAQYVAMGERLYPLFKGIGKIKVGPLYNGWLLTGSQDQYANFGSYTSAKLLTIYDFMGIDTYQPGADAAHAGATMPAERITELRKWLTDHGHPSKPIGVGEYNGFTKEAIAGVGEALLSGNTLFGCVWNNAAARAGILTGDRLTAFKATKADPRALQ